MKKLTFLFALVVSSSFTLYSQDWSTAGNTTTGSEFLGTNVGSSSPNLTFKYLGEFSGIISSNCISFGRNSWNNTTSTFKGNTMIGYEAGRFTSIDNSSNAINGANTYVGAMAGRGISSSSLGVGFNNVCVGSSSGQNLISGNANVFVGANAGRNLSASSSNVCIGTSAGIGTLNNTNGANVIIGNQAGEGNEGFGNVFVGNLSGRALSGQTLISTSGSLNTYIGNGAGRNMTTGSNNTFIGRVTSSSPSTSNTVIIGDGGEFQRLYIHSNGYTGLGLGNDVIPQNSLEINSNNAVANTLGLRFSGFNNTSITNPTNTVLSINAQGDVILVDDKQSSGSGGITSTCTTANFITKSVGTNGNLTCSDIYDNGLNNIGFLYGSAVPTNVNVSVNGTFGATGVFNTSDKKFKKDIKQIDNALEKIMYLEGKTYNWRKDEFKDKNFTDELQFGLLAQDVQKVIPSLVIASENGDLSMNYTGLIPVLIEALKEQQIQINDLKQQLTDNFKERNQELLQFSNTKIISVSPNPSNDMITVSINIEKEIQTATLQVHDLNGLVLSSLNLKERANNITKTLQKDNFGKGIYIISLVVNGKSVDTKKIVFN